MESLIETLEILRDAVFSNDGDKAFEAVTVLLLQFMDAFGHDDHIVAATSPVLENLKNEIQLGDFQAATAITLALLAKFRGVNQAMHSNNAHANFGIGSSRMANPERVAALLDRNLVYGYYSEDSLVFIPEKQARRLCGLWKAATTAKTWGKLRAMLPEIEIAEIMDLLNGDEDHDWHPPDNAKFDGERLYGGDGDWPDWTQQDMLAWVPEAIQTDYGEQSLSFTSGPCLLFDPKNESKLVQAFEQHGYRVAKNERLVRQACGFTDNS